MKCYIDAGNTRIKWQVGPKGEAKALSWAEKSQWPEQLTASVGRGPISKFVIASVASESLRQWLAETLAANFADVPVQWIKSRARCCGVKLAYPEVSQFGVDRFCALVAARHRCPDQGVVVINAGTAITIDYMAPTGQHEGGLIMPSLAAMKAGLNQLAPNLSNSWESGSVEVGVEMGWLATNTAGALQLGSRWMLVSALSQTLDAMKAHASPLPLAVVIGGGDAIALQTWLDPTAQVVENLALEGLKILARQQS
ncbi:type III pantothenate kinase [Halothiobacillus sp.]|uniref:type III pantothenate kinase n=1 Tax=Halothiobacillus sp. TaxID=1891311 RepID=UPI0026209862|nr:type III pantothenate kinase [Halothiobacillus sp.]